MGEDRQGWARVDAWLRERPFVVDALLAAALTALLLPSSMPILWGASWSTAARIAVLFLLVVAHATVAWRRVAPAAAFGVTAAIMLVLVLTPDVDGAASVASGGPVPGILLPSALVFPVLLYAVAAHARSPFPAAALAVGLVGALATTIRLWSPQSWPLSGSLQGYGLRTFIAGALLASVLAPWALGKFRRVRTAYVAALEERAARAEEARRREALQAAAEERARIAREMHDVVAHSLAVIVSQAEGGRLAARADPTVGPLVLQTVSDTGRAALTEMRGLLGLLHGTGDPGSRSGDDSPRAPQPGLAAVPDTVARVRGSGTPVTLTEHGTPGELGRAGELTAYRVVQESLTNVVKHAGPGARAHVTLRWTSDALAVEVVDDGVGPRSQVGAGSGLAGMRERVTLVQGTLETGPAEPRGNRVCARIPLSRSTPRKGTDV